MRQRGDQCLIKLLNNIRVGNLEKQHEDLLNSKFIFQNNPNYPKDAIHIFAENQPASEHNKKMLNSTASDEINIEDIDKITENIPVSMVQKIHSRTQIETSGLAQNLLLKLNARLMLTLNIDISGKVTKIYLRVEDKSTGVKAMRTDPYALQENVTPVSRIEKEIKFNKQNLTSPTIKRMQFPLMLSWACTVHKIQGKTFCKIVVCFDLIKQRAFHSGQIYVALSLVTSLEGLYLRGTFSRSAIKSDTLATEQYNYIREYSKLTSKDAGVQYFLTDEENIATSPIHTSGSLIDHIYVHANVLNTFKVDTFVKNVNFMYELKGLTSQICIQTIEKFVQF
ncbi:ATP-dependent DNA helicase PIF1-like [Hydractinia symbiolongicarpus]|uniref:ATP-dependent DNA helicase PIF1-like n=1 Tax=Hydractinia symbiolongicarpus TaxID=13093 RepID=UPI00254CED55|nr:ATP-dependent DNA helicase PIF1-like [Hydractinia symbiolongicarpus]